MKKLFLAPLALLLTAQITQAAELTTRVVTVDQAEQGATEVMVLAENEGRVLWALAQDEALLEALRISKEQGSFVKLNFDEETGALHSALSVEAPQAIAEEVVIDKAGFTPTVIPSLGQAQAIFNRQDGNTKRMSQCFNRAHGWAYDMWRQSGVNSMKVFIFFTARYIKEYRYKWWFHVAPFVLVQTENSSVEHVMDVTFSNGPMEMRPWTNMFMKNKAFCPTVSRYSDYRQNQWSQDCYLIKMNMYYRSPADLEALDLQGREELGWNLNEVRQAREEAFKNWRDYNP